MSLFNLIITILVICLIAGCFVLSPKQSLKFTIEVTKVCLGVVKVVFYEGRILIGDVMDRLSKEKKE